MRRARFASLVLAAGLLVSSAVALLGGGPARADDTTNLSSFDLTTSAAAMRWEVDLKASPIPAEHTVDLSIPLSRAELSAGPAGHALASTAWPGDTLAKACSAAPQVPCYTVDAETFSPQGPADASNDADRGRRDDGALAGVGEQRHRPLHAARRARRQLRAHERGVAQ